MMFNRADGETEPFCDGLITQPLDEASQHFHLACGKAERILARGKPRSAWNGGSLCTHLLFELFCDWLCTQTLKNFQCSQLRGCVTVHQSHGLLVRTVALFPLFCGTAPI